MNATSRMESYADQLLSRFFLTKSGSESESRSEWLSHWVRSTRALGTSAFEPLETDSSIRDRLVAIYQGYIISARMWPYFSPIPVSKKFKHPSMEALARSTISSCLLYVDQICGGTVLDWRDSESEDDPDSFVPQLYVRPDATECQQFSLVRLFSFNIASTQLMAEIGMRRFLDSFFSAAMGEHSPSWRFLDQADKGYSDTPFCVFFYEGLTALATRQKDLREPAVHALQSTMLLFLAYHYQSHGWHPNRILAAHDMNITLDDRLFAFSICYTDDAVSVFANFPILTRHESGQYMWRFRSQYLQSYRFSSPLNDPERTRIFSAILAVEQHVSVLRRLFSVAS